MASASTPLLNSAWQLSASGQEQEALASLPHELPSANDCSDVEAAMLASILIRAGEIERGETYLQRDWLKGPPQAAGIAGAMGLAVGRPQWAEHLLRYACTDQASANDPSHTVNLGRCLVHLGQPEAAIEALNQLEINTLHGDHYEQWHLSMVEALITAGRHEECMEVLPEEGQSPLIMGTRARVLATLGRHEDAFSELIAGLKSHPQHIELLLALAEIAEAHNQLALSINALEEALSVEPERTELWISMAHTKASAYRYVEAEDAAERAMELAQDQSAEQQASALAVSARVASAQDQLDKAEELYQQALALKPLHPQAISGLGNLLVQMGRVEEGIGQFKRLCTFAPLIGWSQMIQAHQKLDDPAMVQVLEKAAHTPSLQGPVNTGVLFTLASHYDKSGEAEKAFAAAQKANDTSKQSILYSPEAHRASVNAIIRHFNTAFFEQRQGWGSSSTMPVFVVGMPRSGTTLTEQLLASHPDVFGAGELSLIPELIDKINQWEFKLGSSLNYPQCLLELDAESTRIYADEILRELQKLAPEEGTRYITDKLPHNFQNIGLIRLLFPNSRIIHVHRQPRDVAISNYFTDFAAKQCGMGFAYDLEWIGEQLQDEQRLSVHWDSVFPGQILHVNYEDLVADSEGQVQRILDYLALDWNDSVNHFQELNRPVKTASVWQVRQPIYSSSKGRWQRYSAHLEPLEALLQAPLPALPEPETASTLPPGRFHRAMNHLKNGEAQAGHDVLAQLLKEYPGHAAAEHFRGVALLQLGRPRAGLHAIHRSIRRCPMHASWKENLSIAKTLAALARY